MDCVDDIFGEDVKDSSVFRIVSSDEEDSDLLKSPVTRGSSNGFMSNPDSNKSGYSTDRFDRHLKLDKTLESDIKSDTQEIIEEITKIFEPHKEEAPGDSGESKHTVEGPRNLFERGKKIFTRLRSFISSDETDSCDATTGSENSKTGSYNDLTDTTNVFKNTRRRNRSVNFKTISPDSNSDDLSSPDTLDDDEDYNPSEYSEKRLKKNKSQNPKRKRAAGVDAEKFRAKGSKKIFDKFGFQHINTVNDAFEAQNPESARDMFCLKFVVLDENKNPIHDPRLENVFIKSFETVGNIAKKLGEMFNLGPQDHAHIKVIIDGEPLDHLMTIGDPILGVEDKMQIDVKLPSREPLAVKEVRLPTAKGARKRAQKGVHSEPKPTRSKGPEVIQID